MKIPSGVMPSPVISWTRPRSAEAAASECLMWGHAPTAPPPGCAGELHERSDSSRPYTESSEDNFDARQPLDSHLPLFIGVAAGTRGSEGGGGGESLGRYLCSVRKCHAFPSRKGFARRPRLLSNECRVVWFVAAWISSTCAGKQVGNCCSGRRLQA